MKRTQLQLDDELHEALRRRAYEDGCSMSEVVRKILGEALGTRAVGAPHRVEDFGFVGVGESNQGRLAPVSERHDEALAEIE